MIYWFSPLLIAMGQVAAILVFFLCNDMHAFPQRSRGIVLTAAFFLVHAAVQIFLYNYSAAQIIGTLPTLRFLLVTLLYYMVFIRLWSGLSLPVCGFLALIFLLADNCVWPFLVSLSRSLWGISYLHEGKYLLRIPFIILLWLMESAVMFLIRSLLPPLSQIRLNRYNIILTLTSIIPFFYIRIFSSRFSAQTNKTLQVIMTICCLVALITVVSGISQNFYETEKLKSAQMKYILRCQQEQFQQKLKDIDSVNRKYHDMKNILLYLNAQGNSHEVQEQIQTILNDIRSYEYTAITGNEVIDILLNEKLAVCQEKKITCVPYLDGTMLDFVEPLDLCTIFGNALDNAIESCEKIPCEDDRQISIHAVRKGPSVALVFRNTFSRQPVLCAGLPVTTKADAKNHGYGLKNIRYIMDKYQGELSCRVEGQEFILSLLFVCIPENK